jgi:regulator of protease activity HflC (stomatin/prohibitin superfamily)
VLASAVTHRMTLREALVAYDALVTEVLTGLRASQSVQRLGVEIMELAITAIKPTPETAKALEAEARELICDRQTRRSTRGGTRPSSRSGGSRRAS